MLVILIRTAVVAVAGVLALILVALAKRAVETDDLGSVSHHWIGAHRTISA